MWSLPDIVRLNHDAAEDAAQAKLQREVEHPQEHSCEVCEWDAEETPAQYGYLWFDIFSDDPKGSIFLCERHDGYTGSPIEGYFTCSECNRVLIENYSWELYSVVVDCEQLCLPCALRRYVDEPSHWIAPHDVQQVVLNPDCQQEEDAWGEVGWNRVFDAETGILNLAACPHLIGVKMPIPDDLHFVGNLEFDSSSGALLAGYSSTFAPGVGESSALKRIQKLAAAGHKSFIPILDAAYQFSVSIGLYVRSERHDWSGREMASTSLEKVS